MSLVYFYSNPTLLAYFLNPRKKILHTPLVTAFFQVPSSKIFTYANNQFVQFFFHPSFHKFSQKSLAYTCVTKVRNLRGLLLFINMWVSRLRAQLKKMSPTPLTNASVNNCLSEVTPKNIHHHILWIHVSTSVTSLYESDEKIRN